jgi:hypothetical protein
MVAIEEILKQAEEDVDKVSSNTVAIEEIPMQSEEDADKVSDNIVAVWRYSSRSVVNGYRRKTQAV